MLIMPGAAQDKNNSRETEKNNKKKQNKTWVNTVSDCWYHLFWHLRSERRRLRGHAAVRQNLTVLPEKRVDREVKPTDHKYRKLIGVFYNSNLSNGTFLGSESFT